MPVNEKAPSLTFFFWKDLDKFAILHLAIMEELEIFLSSEQPATCPKCGNRTEIICDFKASQHHKCLSPNCNFCFILEFENQENTVKVKHL